MRDSARIPKSLHHSALPLGVAAVGLIVYLLTINSWVSLESLPVVMRLSGWEWTPAIHTPLLYVLTLPLRWLPDAWQPLGMNLFTALGAAATLGLLARSVILLPHDRTRDQRRVEHSEFSLLSIPEAWVPPILAALVCGLQLTFWEHATAITGEMLDLLVFAYVIRALLEYRLDGRESWLSKLALVYGLGVANNWAMIGFFPGFLAALIWIKGRSFFNGRFFIRTTLLGFAGLLLYLLLPLIGVWTSDNYTFWQLLKSNLSNQKNILLIYPKYVVLLCGLTSLLPVLAMGIRWPSSFGDTSAVGVGMTNLLFRATHLMFLAACAWVVFDPKFSPRQLGFGLPFLTFYYLGALSIGYYSGYVLLVCGNREKQPWLHISGLRKLVNAALLGLVWLALLALPALLVYRNLPLVRTANGPELKQFVEHKRAALPATDAVLVGDDPIQLGLLEASVRGHSPEAGYTFLNTRFLPLLHYHEWLEEQRPVWAGTVERHQLTNGVDVPKLIQIMSQLAQSNEVFYLHPSFGYYFEALDLQPDGLVYRFQPAGTNFAPASLAPELVQKNQTFWNQLEPQLEDLARRVAAKHPTAEALGRNYSRALNYWAVELQKRGDLAAAAKGYELALRLNPENLSALVNREFNRSLQKGEPVAVKIDKSVEEKFARFRSWDFVLGANGPIDEPNFCFKLGQVFARNSQYRQAAHLFGRAETLGLISLREFEKPERKSAFREELLSAREHLFNVRLWLANTCLQAQVPAEVLRLVQAIRADATAYPLTPAQRSELVRLEAWAAFRQHDLSRAEKVLRQAQPEFPQDSSLLDALSQMYLLSGQYTNALKVLDEQLELEPKNLRALLNKGAICIQVKDFSRAVPPLDSVLQQQPDNRAALMNRAIAHLQSGQLDAAQQDYEALRLAFPNLFSVYYGLGEIAYRRKQAPVALTFYNLYLKNAPPGAEETSFVTARIHELQQAGGK